MIKKRKSNLDLEPKIVQAEMEAFEQGIAKSRPPAKKNDRPADSPKSGPKLKHLLTKLRPKRQHRILIIEDEDSFRRMLCEHLTQSGYEVIEACNGEEGVKLFLESPADVVISDVIMPQKEGIETIVEIKRQFPKVNIIIMSGGGWYGTDIDFDMAKKLGAVTLEKPFELKALSQSIEKLLS